MRRRHHAPRTEEGRAALATGLALAGTMLAAAGTASADANGGYTTKAAV
ncbi:hypothetical protein GXW82_14615 [Streptacidiphilus sp. 4-A2]|nr:hypothetical protein [Streptacidiphilus sp. 4-A2]